MTQKQYERWKEFALAMARDGFERMTPERKKRLTDEVESWFWWREFQKDWHKMESWDQGENGYYVCDLINDFYEEHQHEKPYRNGDVEVYGRFYDQINCCLRAGLDVAVKPSAGVVGFTVGDLRRMYGGRVPLWISRQYKGGLAKAKDTEAVWL